MLAASGQRIKVSSRFYHDETSWHGNGPLLFVCMTAPAFLRHPLLGPGAFCTLHAAANVRTEPVGSCLHAQPSKLSIRAHARFRGR